MSEVKMEVRAKIILDLCAGTGAWSKSYSQVGYDVRLITLPETDIRTYQEPQSVYGILFAAPCTVWANSGARWWTQRTRDEIFEAAQILSRGLMIIARAKPHFWAIENPIGKMRQLLGEPRLIFDPCDYGDPYTKRTYLWGQFNIPEKHQVRSVHKNFIHYIGPGPDRQKIRSITPSGFAQAFFEANR